LRETRYRTFPHGCCRYPKILGHDRLATTAIYLNLTDTHVVDEYSQKW
jgi:hypothetical protein